MTTLSKIYYWYRENKCKSLIIGLIIFFITAAPLIFYLWNFRHGLSEDANAWVVFGTYIGGVYGPVFTLTSVIVLVVTVVEINQSNRINIELSKNVNIISEIIELSKLLDNSLEKNKHLTHSGRNYTFEWFANAVQSKFIGNDPGSEEEIKDASILRFKDNDIDLFRDEMFILKEILLRIHNIDDEDLQERARAIFKGIIPNQERYWMACYVSRFHKDMKLLIALWPNFSVMPKYLYDLLQDPEEFSNHP
jgi:uncharacterized membrane protein